jgi:Protein of unknown function (DUF1097)
MKLLQALALVIGVMGGIATWAAVSMASPFFLIWAIFIAWGSYFHCGGGKERATASIPANIWGAVMAVAALIALTSMGVTALNAGICVGVPVLVMILGANIPLLGAIPASVYGYASTAALSLMGGAGYGEGPNGIVMVGVAIAVSMVIGNLLGYISNEIVGALTKNSKYCGGCAHVQPCLLPDQSTITAATATCVRT